MSIPVELPASVEPRDRDLKYSARRFSGEFPQIEAAKHFAAIAGSALSFGVYGCPAGAMPTEFTAALASAGHAALPAVLKVLAEDVDKALCSVCGHELIGDVCPVVGCSGAIPGARPIAEDVDDG